MKAYHGSHLSGLKKLIYTEENSRFGGDANLVHGAGIYLTISKEEALAYATSSLYSIEISGEVFDATDPEVLKAFILNLLNTWNVSLDIINNETLKSLIKRTSQGDISGVSFAKNISDVFSNDYSLYSAVLQEKFQDDIDALSSSVESLFHFKLIKIRHKGNGTDWVICTDHDGYGLEIIDEIESSL